MGLYGEKNGINSLNVFARSRYRYVTLQERTVVVNGGTANMWVSQMILGTWVKYLQVLVIQRFPSPARSVIYFLPIIQANVYSCSPQAEGCFTFCHYLQGQLCLSTSHNLSSVLTVTSSLPSLSHFNPHVASVVSPSTSRLVSFFVFH